MRDYKRIDPLLSDLAEVWKQHPDLRLCQLLSALVNTESTYNSNDLFYVEDDRIARALKIWKEDDKNRSYK